VGLVVLVLSDYFYNPRSSATNPVLGDVLCLAGSILYAISNVGQEFMVKEFDRTEWLAMIGVGGSLVCGIQLAIFEREELNGIQWSAPVVLLIVAFGILLFALYSLTPFMMILGSATLFNLSLLTSDVYAIIVGIFLFDSKPSFLYFIAFAIIITGLILYNMVFGMENRQDYKEIDKQEEAPIIEEVNVEKNPPMSTV